MPAPDFTLTRGSITYTPEQPIELRGFRINISLSSSAEGADWGFSIASQLMDADVVDEADRSFRATRTGVIPHNEAPSFNDVVTRLKTLVDEVYDSIPTPAEPAA